MQAVTHSVGVLQAQCPLFEEAVEDLKQESAITQKHQRLGAGRPTNAVKGALKIGSRLMQEHDDIEYQQPEMIAAGVVEGAGVDVRGWGRGGRKGSGRKGKGRGTGRSRGSGRGRSHCWSEGPA